MNDIEAIVAPHRYVTIDGFCPDCGHKAPCPVIRLADVLSTAEAEADALRKFVRWLADKNPTSGNGWTMPVQIHIVQRAREALDAAHNARKERGIADEVTEK